MAHTMATGAGPGVPGGDGTAGRPDAERVREACRTALERARRRTRGLTGVPDAELTAQHSVIMSPLVWDLAHIANQEDLWLVRAAGGRAATPAVPGGDGAATRDPGAGAEAATADAAVDDLYNAFRHPRRSRPALPLLGPGAARGYADRVRRTAIDVLDACEFGAACPFDRDGQAGRRLTAGGFVFGMVAQHEQQHDETMLATHQLRTGPALLQAPPAPAAPLPGLAGTRVPEVVVPGGPFTMGTDGDGGPEAWALDNERPAHSVVVPAFALEAVPVTNRRYAAFIADGGYERPGLWSERGWAHRAEAGLTAPGAWYPDGDGGWRRRRFGVDEQVPPDEPVVHVCYFEAEAFAAWAGKRLPTEAEWEKAARHDPDTGRSRTYPWGEAEPGERHANLGQRHLSPAAVGSYPHGATASGIHQLLGDVWEWTSSGFEAYPGFAAFPYREYSEVFFGGDYRVLRGGSFGTDAVACRGTFRNWDHPVRRQIFAGIRLARDCGDA